MGLGSSGSQIILINSKKVVGIHIGEDKRKSENYGYCLGPIFNFFNNFSDNKKIMNNNIYKQNAILNIEQDIKNNVNIINNINPLVKIDNLNDIPINKYSNKNQLNKTTLLYEINEDPARIFGYRFVRNNKNNCCLLINGIEKELCQILFENNATKGHYKIILIEKNIFTDMSYMFGDNTFFEQKSLIFLPDISEWNTKYVTNMKSIFYNCILLTSLSDISKWNTKCY